LALHPVGVAGQADDSPTLVPAVTSGVSGLIAGPTSAVARLEDSGEAFQHGSAARYQRVARRTRYRSMLCPHS